MTPPGITRYPGGYDYYHEKITQQEGGREEKTTGKGQASAGKRDANTQHLTPDTQHPAPTAKADRKELRKQRALDRQAMYDQTKDLKKAIKRAEGEVERLEAEKATLSQQLNAPTETTNFASLSRRLGQVQYEIDIATTKWEKATEELEKVVGEQETD
jgi:ATP-binding cassette, subfamily F, member 3